MIRKLLYLLGYLLIATIGLAGTIYNTLIITGCQRLEPSTRPDWQIAVLIGIFGVVALIGSVMFGARLKRMLIDIKINKENK